jgi:hypothetical protein
MAQIELVAGALSSEPEKARASGQDLGLADDRNHGQLAGTYWLMNCAGRPVSASTS